MINSLSFVSRENNSPRQVFKMTVYGPEQWIRWSRVARRLLNV